MQAEQTYPTVVAVKHRFTVPVNEYECNIIMDQLNGPFDELDLDYTWHFIVFNWAKRRFGEWADENGWDWHEFWHNMVELDKCEEELTITFDQEFGDEAILFKLTFVGAA